MNDVIKNFLTDPRNVELFKRNDISGFMKNLNKSELDFTDRTALCEFLMEDAGIDILHKSNNLCSGFLCEKNISTLYIPGNILDMQKYAVSNCMIQKLTFDENVELDFFSELPFYWCHISNLIINCPVIPEYGIFYDSIIKNIVINSQLVYVDDADLADMSTTFIDCDGIESIHLTKVFCNTEEELCTIVYSLFDGSSIRYLENSHVPIYANYASSPVYLKE